MKDLERMSAETNHLREQKEKLEQDIQVWVRECVREETPVIRVAWTIASPVLYIFLEVVGAKNF